MTACLIWSATRKEWFLNNPSGQQFATSCVTSLAIRSAIPILADALQDAGCENDDILTHCRGPGPHVRGCWVVDLVLGKS
jgi:hypothetical protein